MTGYHFGPPLVLLSCLWAYTRGQLIPSFFYPPLFSLSSWLFSSYPLAYTFFFLSSLFLSFSMVFSSYPVARLFTKEHFRKLFESMLPLNYHVFRSDVLSFPPLSLFSCCSDCCFFFSNIDLVVVACFLRACRLVAALGLACGTQKSSMSDLDFAAGLSEAITVARTNATIKDMAAWDMAVTAQK